jgi:type 1 fimbria pilin
MKKFSKLFILTALAASACGSALAEAPSVTLKVTGKIKPPACTAAITGGGTYDYGNISTNALSPSDITMLEVKSDTFTVSCDAKAKVALKMADDKEGTEAFTSGANFFGRSGLASDVYMGLGTANTKPIGAYAVRLKPDGVTADSAKVDVIASADSGNSWSKSTHGIFSTTTGARSSWAIDGTTTPLAAKVVTGTLDVQAAIEKTANLDLSSEIDLDGQATIELVYL